MRSISYSEEQQIAASQNLRERDYWLKKLSGEWEKSGFPYDYEKKYCTPGIRGGMESVSFTFPGPLSARIMNICGGSDYTLHILLTAGVVELLSKYSGKKDIVLATPIYKQEKQSQFINTLLAIRTRLHNGMSFKDLLVLLREVTREAVEHQNYPMEILAEKLKLPLSETDFPLFEVAVLLENVHEKKYLRQDRIPFHLVFSCLRTEDRCIEGRVEYNPSLYRETTIQKIAAHLVQLLESALLDVNTQLSGIAVLSPGERRQLLIDFNSTAGDYPHDKTLPGLFEEQAEKSPHDTAVVDTDGVYHLTYKELNEKANRLARYLVKRGVRPDQVVGLMMDNSLEMIISILGVLKAGGAYLPIDPGLPEQRILAMLKDSSASIFLTKECLMGKFKFINFQGFEHARIKKIITPKRPQVMDLDTLQFPDRSLVDYEKYHPYIGQSMVKNSVTVQFSRGCIFKCLYCFKIWPDKYSLRTGENLFEEVNMYHKVGIRRFGFTDDLPNFNKKEIGKFYRLIIKNKLKIHLHFPNGIRGDILTPDFIDLMMEAGAVTMDLALETGSPRLQKLIRKNVNIERLRRNVEYIIENYPRAILGVQIMHGFPTETEEEARASLEFIKSFRRLPFGYMHILKIYPNTAMARFAMENGISEEDIIKSMDLAYHELPYTLPFSENFTRQCQAEYLGEFFLNKERLLAVLPNQMAMLTEDELVQKYNSYLPVDIKTFSDLLNYIGIDRTEIKGEFLPENFGRVEDFNEKVRQYFPVHKSDADATRLLLLDLSQHFSHESQEMYHVVDPPLGLMYLLTHLNKTFGPRIQGKIAKSQVDFDGYDELKELVERFKPDIIGVRSMNYFRNFCHKAIALIRQWGFDGPIIAGGPYATSSYDTMLQDVNIDLAVLEEGEITMAELMTAIMNNGGQLPDESVLKTILNVAFVGQKEKILQKQVNREVLMMERLTELLSGESHQNPEPVNHPNDLAYIIYTSGSTGTPKGVMVQHRNVVNQLIGLRKNFNLDASFNYLLLAAYTFDVSVMHLFSAITSGAKLFLITEDVKKDPLKLWPFIHENNINILNIVPAFMRVLLENIEKDKIHFSYLFVGGDVFKPELHASLEDTFKTEQIINIYGPTETTINAAFYSCDGIESAGRIPIGKPVMNYKAYILDNDLNPAPIGGRGELCISGDGVARGYLNRPHLTAEKFIPNPFSEGEIMYRTGDQARWLPDGNIEFLGRADSQVKIRGFRIELEEIEKQLLAMEQIKEAVVLVKEDEAGDKFLNAYVTSGQELVSSGLRDCLAAELPDYMVPTYILQVEKMPLTPNGKIDTRVLRETQIKLKGEYVPPSNEMEKQLARIWSEVLGMDENAVSVNANFFDLGGHSLKATILISKIHKTFNVKIPLIQLFKTPKIRDLSGYIESLTEDKYVSIEAVEEKEYYALSSAQTRLHFLQQLQPDNTAYNISGVLRLAKKVDPEKIENVIRRLIRRHESLRTSFEMIKEEPIQKVHREVDFKIEYFDPGHEREETEYIIKNFVKPFDLSRAPLLRVGLIKEKNDGHLLLLDMHHIISDGVSHNILVQDFDSLYRGEALPPLRLQYKDFSQWQRDLSQQGDEKRTAQETYWLNEFAGENPVINLPTDFPRPPLQVFEGTRIGFVLDKKTTTALRRIALDQGATLYMVLLAVFNVFLAKISGQQDIVVGTPVAGRGHADLEKIIGIFINTVLLRNYPGGEKTFTRFLQEVKEKTLKGLENQEYPFEDLVEKVDVNRDTSRNPLFDVMFSFQVVEGKAEAVPGEKPADTGQKPYEYGNSAAKFDLSLHCFESKEDIRCILEYSTSLFKTETARRFSDYFTRVVSDVSKTPALRISGIEIMDPEEKERILYGFNRTQTDYPNKTIHELFEHQAEKTPHHLAVQCADHHLTYDQLNRRSNQAARLLRARNVGTDSIAAIMLNPSIEIPLGILAVLKAGGGYLPIDPRYPEERINYILEDSRSTVMITHPPLAGAGTLTPSHRTIETIDIQSPDIYCGDPGNPDNVALPQHIVYTIYTSGTTGKPKGVLLTHRNLVNYVHWFAQTAGLTLTGENRTLLSSSFAFDLGYTSIYPSLLTGASLHILDREPYLLADTLVDCILRNRVTYLKITPSLFSVVVHSPGFSGETCRHLRLVVMGGEPINLEDVETVHQTCPHIRVINHYGPTEATIGCVAQFIDFDRFNEYKENSTIGKPISNTRVYILDNGLQPVPAGVPGELCISGTCLARGYLNRPQLTKEKFTFPALHPHIPLYRTGDLARWRPDGHIEFLGRTDQQVKIRGFRIELSEIENQLLSHDEIKETAVLIKENKTGEKYLCAYVVPRGKIETPGLRDFLSGQLPNYMIPNYFVQLQNIPLTPNGKIDRRTLPDPEIKAGRGYVAPRNGIDEKLVKIWSQVLGLDEAVVGIDSNFFELGGHSLRATILLAKIHKEFNVKISIAKLFETPTIEGLAQYIGTSGQDKYISVDPVEKREYYPVSSAQKRLYFLQQLEPEGTAYNVPQVFKIQKSLEREKLKDIFKRMLQRHESLRTSLEMIYDQPRQRVHTFHEIEFEMEYYDFSMEKLADGEIKEIMKTFIRPFDLHHPPLIRVRFIETGMKENLLMVDMHHVVSDEISHNVLLDDCMALSRGEELAPLRVQYKDYAGWQNSKEQREVLKQQEEYWLAEFRGDIPQLALSTDFQGAGNQNIEGDVVIAVIEESDLEKIRALERRENVTMFMIVLSLLNVLLFKLSGQGDINVGTVVLGRRHADLEKIIGMFVNTLVMRNFPGENKTFREFLRDVKKRSLDAFANQDYQFEELVDKVVKSRTGRHNPLFDVFLTFYNHDEKGRYGEFLADQKQIDINMQAKFELGLVGLEYSNELVLILFHRKSLYKKETIERFMSYLKDIIASVMENNDIYLKDITISSDLGVAKSEVLRADESGFGF